MKAHLRAVAVGFGWTGRRQAAELGVMAGLTAAAAAAWLLFVLTSIYRTGNTAPATGDAMPSMPWMPGMQTAGAGARPPGASMLFSSGVALGMAMWTLMVVAMMLPAGLPAVRYVAGSSLYWRRRRAMATFAAAYLSIWVVFGGILYAMFSARPPAAGGAPFAAALALAAGWQLTPAKNTALGDCHRPSPLPPRGWQATAGVIRFGLWNGFACLRSCWAMMLAMALASPMASVWMAAITGLVIVERFAQRPRRSARVVAAVLSASALSVAISGLAK